jgi:hypothetical protein
VVQALPADANSDPPTDTALVFRMGLHLGDLIVDGGDLHGGIVISWRHCHVAREVAVSMDAR